MWHHYSGLQKNLGLELGSQWILFMALEDSDEAALELETRRKIYEYISKTPGAHFREIHRKLGVPTGVAEYHIKYLEDKDLIVGKKEGRYKRFYVVGKLGSADKKIMALLRQDIPRGILMHLLLHPNAKHKDLRSLFTVSASTLSFHLKKLINNELIREIPKGREKEYEVIDPDNVVKTLITYKEGFLDSLVDSFVETWMELHP